MVVQQNFTAVAGSQWAQTYMFPTVDITGLTWEFAIRPNVTDTAQPPLVKVTTTVSGQGQITVDTVARSLQVVLTPAATSLLGKGARAHALWSNQNTTTATNWVAGIFNSSLAAMP